MSRWITPLLAIVVVGLSIAFLFVDLDEDGWLHPPRPPGVRRPLDADWTARLGLGDEVPVAAGTFAATASGIRDALTRSAPALRACQAAWVAGDSSAPRQVGARIRIAEQDDHGGVVGVDVDSRAGGVERMEACAVEALAPVRFSGVPATGLVVVWSLDLEEETP